MGSPRDDDERFDWEFLPRETKIELGFWIFDTPCTQALWEAVMGEGKNLSQFKGAARPVERVSWNDCQDFLKRLNERLNGLGLSLPLEAQWEYACRAGTPTPRYQENLDEIAWYAQNSGGETHAVGNKAPNAWGLYDLLGNVWEWCADEWRIGDPGSGAPGSGGPLVPRVLRGGSWVRYARYVRAACRIWLDPADRHDNIGFRCAEFRSGS
jgi:formylglycine-generating enzyme required for sulfatase activity